VLAQRFRRPRRSLAPEEVSALVRMRDGGATWKEIGVAFRKQETACKAIFDKAAGDPKGSREDATPLAP
jgi:hypothetical protein